MKATRQLWRAVPSSWLRREGRRLDVGPYMSGALEAKVRLEGLTVEKSRLGDLTEGGDDGVYHAGRESRLWVEGPDHGVPFLGSTDILRADISHLPLIARKQVERTPKFIIRKGWTLITRSGTIGRMAYARPDMDGLACSEHVMRVVPDARKVPPGYLYAYLGSRFGVPLVVAGTYGSIIQSIEPHHIADLPVPRLGESTEGSAHTLVEEAARVRAQAAATLNNIGNRFDRLLDGLASPEFTPRVSVVPASSLRARLDAQFHDPEVVDIRARLRAAPHTTIGEFCPTVFLPGIFKRIHIDDVRFGAPYYTGASLFWLEPQPKGILSRKTTLFDDVQLERGTVLIQAFGQDGGLTGRSVWVGENLHGATTTHMLVRLRADSLERTAYLFGFLQSEAAYRQIAVLTYGGSIPHFDEAGIKSVVVPLLDDREAREISDRVLSATEGRDKALKLEREARAMVESAIEEAT